MRKSNFDIVSQLPDRVIIQDLGPWDKYRSVTNDAENVVEALISLLKGRRLLYYDSVGELDEILIRDGKFAGFAPVKD